MIGRLRGSIAATGDGQALIDVGGVGYLVHAGARTLARLQVGQAAEIFVETQMSESLIRLYGFLSGEERVWFARLQDAPGVGARIALAILDTLSPAQLADAIALGDTGQLSRANGVGKKLAERIITEFRGKPAPIGLFAALPAEPRAALAAAGGGARAGAMSALINLGYSQADAVRAVAQAMRDAGEEAGESALIRAALKALAPAS
jgi:Holliday junction DNA helicase RuvA